MQGSFAPLPALHTLHPLRQSMRVQLKIRQQLQQVSAGQEGYVGPLKLLQRIGLKGAYHGTAVTLARDIPSFGVYFLTYKVLPSKKSVGIVVCKCLTEPFAGARAACKSGWYGQKSS
jgi:hypothetical protein